MRREISLKALLRVRCRSSSDPLFRRPVVELAFSDPRTGQVRSPLLHSSHTRKRFSASLVSVLRAVESGLGDGLIAHEVGHMLRTEARHPSHSPEVYRLIAKEVRIPRAAEAAFGQAFNHVQDVYADDLAFPVFAGADGRRAYD